MPNGNLLRGFELHFVALLAVTALVECCRGEEPSIAERKITIRSGPRAEIDMPRDVTRQGH